MSSPQYSVSFNAPLSGTSGNGVVGTVLIPDATSGLFVVATSANRGARRSTGIALQNFVAGSAVDIQQFGSVLGSTLATLGPGSASWVRVSSTGTLERATVSGSDDVVGYVETDGTFHACFGLLTAAIVNGGGGSFTPPTGTGLVTVTSGALDAAATGLGTGIATWLGTPSGANFASALTSTIPNTKGGLGTDASAFTGVAKWSAGVASAAALVNADVSASAAIAVSKLAPGTNTYVLTTTGGVAVWAAPSGGGGTPAGVSGDIQINSAGAFGALTPATGIATFLTTPSGANLGAALTSALTAAKGGTGVTALTSFTTAITTTGALTGAQIAASGVVTDATSGGTFNNVTTTNIGMIRYTDASPGSVTGFANGVQGKRLTIVSTTGTMFLNHEDASSTAANRMTLYAASNTAVYAGCALELVYDATSQRWCQIL